MDNYGHYGNNMNMVNPAYANNMNMGGYGGGYGCHHKGYGGGFTIIVVLFILLIIVGASAYKC